MGFYTDEEVNQVPQGQAMQGPRLYSDEEVMRPQERPFGEKLANFWERIKANPPSFIGGLIRDAANLPQSATQLGDIARSENPYANADEAERLAGNTLRGVATVAPTVAPRVGAAATPVARMGMHPPVTPEVPTPQALKIAAQEQGYRPAEQRAASIAVPEHAAQVEGWKADLGRTPSNRPEASPDTHRLLDALGNKAAIDVGDLMNLRGNGKYGLRSLNEPAATALTPKVEALMDELSPGIMDQIRTADANYQHGMVTGRLDTRLARKEAGRAGQLGDRLRDAASQELNSSNARFLNNEQRQALEQMAAKTQMETALSKIGTVGGALPYTLHGLAGLATGTPATMAVPLAGTLARMGYNRSVAARADALRATLARQSPLFQSANLAAQAAAGHQGALANTEFGNALGILGRPAGAAAPGLLQALRQGQQ